MKKSVSKKKRSHSWNKTKPIFSRLLPFFAHCSTSAEYCNRTVNQLWVKKACERIEENKKKKKKQEHNTVQFKITIIVCFSWSILVWWNHACVPCQRNMFVYFATVHGKFCYVVKYVRKKILFKWKKLRILIYWIEQLLLLSFKKNFRSLGLQKKSYYCLSESLSHHLTKICC